MNKHRVIINAALCLYILFLLPFISAEGSVSTQCRGMLKKDPCGRCVSLPAKATFPQCPKGHHWKLINGKCQCVVEVVPAQCQSGYKKATDACGRTKCILENTAPATCAAGYRGKLVNGKCQCVKD